MARRSLDDIEAEIRDTRGRMATLLARADRHYGLRAGLGGLRRLAPDPAGNGPDSTGLWRALALPAAILAFVAGLLGARRAARAKRDC